MGAWLLYAGLLSAQYLSPREQVDARNVILVHIKSAFPHTDTRGAFLKEMALGQEKLSTLIETRSGALRAVQILQEARSETDEHHLIRQTITTVLRSALEYVKHANDIGAKYPQLKPAIKFYKMRLYKTLTVTPCDVWEHSLADLFKHVAADLTLVDVVTITITGG